MKLLVVGSAIVDVIARPTSHVATDTSNEGEIQLGAGGAGRNVAENLKRLGCDVTLVTDLAEDFLGRFLQDNLQTLGIETRWSARRKTGLYLALLKRDGTLDRGFCATGTEHVTPEELLAATEDMASFDGVVIDANLCEAGVAALADRCRSLKVPFAVETVANERARRALPALPGCTLIKPDRAEARMLTGLPCDTWTEAAACAQRLRSQGAGTVIVSLGAEGFHLEHAAYSGHIGPAPTQVVDVTGAGDALFSAAFVGLLRGLPPRQVADIARRAAALAVASPHAVSPAIHPGLLQEAPRHD